MPYSTQNVPQKEFLRSNGWNRVLSTCPQQRLVFNLSLKHVFCHTREKKKHNHARRKNNAKRQEAKCAGGFILLKGILWINTEKTIIGLNEVVCGLGFLPEKECLWWQLINVEIPLFRWYLSMAHCGFMRFSGLDEVNSPSDYKFHFTVSGNGLKMFHCHCQTLWGIRNYWGEGDVVLRHKNASNSAHHHQEANIFHDKNQPTVLEELVTDVLTSISVRLDSVGFYPQGIYSPASLFDWFLFCVLEFEIHTFMHGIVRPSANYEWRKNIKCVGNAADCWILYATIDLFVGKWSPLAKEWTSAFSVWFCSKTVGKVKGDAFAENKCIGYIERLSILTC